MEKKKSLEGKSIEKTNKNDDTASNASESLSCSVRLFESLDLPPIDESFYKIPAPPPFVEDFESLGTVVFCVSSRSEIAKSRDPSDNSPLLIAWSDMLLTTDTEFPTIVQTFFKKGYRICRKDPTFFPLINPFPQNIQCLRTFRHDYRGGRAIFHYVGYGFPQLGNDGIYTRIENGRQSLLMTYEDLFSNIGAPSLFVFDCENAGSVINAFKAAEEHLKEKSNSASNYSINSDDWNDWYCMCTTGPGEKLPDDPMLPKDLLSTILLTPIPISILFHILRYYKTSFKVSPLEYIGNILKEESKDVIDKLSEVLETVTECVASDYLATPLFRLLFRREPFVSVLFKRFVLAQFMLNQCSIHPISHPYLPPMWNHPYWVQWESIIDIWISKKIVPAPFVSNLYYSSLASSFSSSVFHGKLASIKNSQLVAALFIPSKSQPKTTALVPLAVYAADSEQNRINITSLINFSSFIALLFDMPRNIEKAIKEKKQFTSMIFDFHALCYIIISVLSKDINILVEAQKNFNIDHYINLIMNPLIPTSTKTLATAVLAIIIKPIKSLRTSCMQRSFYRKLTNALTVSDSSLTLWYLLLIKRANEFLSIPSRAHEANLESYITQLLFHNSPEIRAAAVSALSLFCTDDEHISKIMFTLIFALFDCSFIVRNQVLLIAIRCLVSHLPITEEMLNKSTKGSSFNDILKEMLGTEDHFSKYITDFDSFVKATEREHTKEELLKLLTFIISYLTCDPHESVRNNAEKAKEMFIQNKAQMSISIPLGMQEGKTDDFLIASIENSYDDIEFPSDNVALFEASKDQLVRSGMWSPEEIYYKVQPAPPSASKLSQVSSPNALVATVHNTLQGSKPILTTYMDNDLIVADDNNTIHILNQDLETREKIVLSKAQTCDIRSARDRLIISTVDGCVRVWSERKPLISFRASSDYSSQPLLQLAAPSDICNEWIATARGTSSVALWDISYKKMLGEWNSLSLPASALHTDQASQFVAYIGCSNGSVAMVDFRTDMTAKPVHSANFKEEEKIIGMGSLINDNYSIFAATEEGNVFKWDTRTDEYQNICSVDDKLVSFAVQRPSNTFLLSPMNSLPSIYSVDGTLLIKGQNTSAFGGLIASHKTLSVGTLIYQNCEMSTYQMVHNA